MDRYNGDEQTHNSGGSMHSCKQSLSSSGSVVIDKVFRNLLLDRLSAKINIFLIPTLFDDEVNARMERA